MFFSFSIWENYVQADFFLTVGSLISLVFIREVLNIHRFLNKLLNKWEHDSEISVN